jgi:hypothetical protein
LNAEGELGFGKFCLAPIPTAQGVFLVLKDCAVPVLEDFGQSIIVLLQKSIELDYTGFRTLYNLDLVALRSATPLRRGNVVMVEGEGLAAADRLPSETGFGESALATLLGKIQVDVVEALAVDR